jgi:hypothetical protein
VTGMVTGGILPLIKNMQDLRNPNHFMITFYTDLPQKKPTSFILLVP